MSEDSAAEDRTEAPTQRRLEQARDSGQLAVSRDLIMLASLLGAAAGCIAVAPGAGRRLTVQAADLIASSGRIDLGGLPGQLGNVLLPAALLVGGIAVPAAACAILCGLMQTGFYLAKTPIKIEASRLSPMAGMGRLLSRQHLLDFLKSLLRLTVLGLLAWSVLAGRTHEGVAAMGADAVQILLTAGGQVGSFARPLLVVMAGFAALDYFLVRHAHGRKMRMTREQVRLEARDSDGDPHVKGKLRRLRMQRSKQRMMAKVRTADVVITNPTHYAIALSYASGGDAAPKVVAKGVDFLAARIREEAMAHRIPLFPNPPLARALYQVELDREIPAEHFRAVAEVIAYVWKLNKRGGPVR
ncbi:MAG: EscU/YscU/HrcU family type III secretion system export apparatus switch protein [Janthinobacterium lividum]